MHSGCTEQRQTQGADSDKVQRRKPQMIPSANPGLANKVLSRHFGSKPFKGNLTEVHEISKTINKVNPELESGWIDIKREFIPLWALGV